VGTKIHKNSDNDEFYTKNNVFSAQNVWRFERKTLILQRIFDI
jgi:hypothetical protein